SLPAFVIRDLSLPTRLLALKEAHFPPDDADPVEYVRFRSPAQRRLIFEEFFDLSFALLLRRGIRKRLRKQAVIELPKAVKKEIASLL
ncbi:hypothetical protein OFM41_30945, partial [Escherichia coli]|nr:hypothetical protein [Escherichia coli]